MQARRYEQAESGYQVVIRAGAAERTRRMFYGRHTAGWRYSINKPAGPRWPSSIPQGHRHDRPRVEQADQRRLENDLSGADTLIGFFQDYVDFLIERGQTEKALEVAESSRARVLNQRLEHPRSGSGELPDRQGSPRRKRLTR
jgi:hypothetical protein